MNNNESSTTRYLVYKASASKHFLCACAARDRKHALDIARQQHILTRSAYARPEITADLAREAEEDKSDNLPRALLAARGALGGLAIQLEDAGNNDEYAFHVSQCREAIDTITTWMVAISANGRI
jgi:hypothetical protein